MKKTRPIRRRGRGQDVLGSDDEIEREIATDSESDTDVLSTHSSSESETENIQDSASTPSAPATSARHSKTKKDSKAAASPYFGGSGNWSEMVTAEEGVDGPADLPVIDFAELNGNSIPTRKPTKSSKKKAKASAAASRVTPAEASSLPSPPLSAKDDESPASEIPPVSLDATPSTSTNGRAPGQSARQLYQNRLQSDPSYVPVVGEFWGHDDRLLDKDLRSLSPWWRGRWQNRGRGRVGPAMRGGRAGFMGRSALGREASEAEEKELPPVDRAWGHDGYEELKKSEERRRYAQSQRAEPQASTRGSPNFRGRGGFSNVRGRGSFMRGGLNQSSFRPPVAGRPWYSMKPEHPWTRQHDGFLHFDPSHLLRKGSPFVVRIKLPGRREQNARMHGKPLHADVSQTEPDTHEGSLFGSDYSDRVIAVKIPSFKGKEKAKEGETSPKITTKLAEKDEEDVFTVRPSLVERKPLPLPKPSNVKAAPPKETRQSSSPDALVQRTLESVGLETPQESSTLTKLTEEAVMKHSETAENVRSETAGVLTTDRPSLPPLQTTMPAPAPAPAPAESHQSPSYTSPYMYGPTLPPGIAMNQLGMPYEIATGRPVYLPQTPMYQQPQPMMPPVPYMPNNHLRHPSVVSDFSHPSHSSPVPYYEPQPVMYSLPRPSVPVQIRAPDDKHTPSSASALRSEAAAFEPSQDPSTTRQQSFNATGRADTASPSWIPPSTEGVMHNGMMVFPHAYQTPYYYMDPYAGGSSFVGSSPYGGGYSPYMDGSQLPHQQYEMYPPPGPDGAVYYQ